MSVARGKKRGSKEVQEELRKRAVLAVESGQSMRQVALSFGVSYSAVRGWCKKHREADLEALTSKKRGRKAGDGRRLSPSQEARLLKLITDQTPEQLKLPFMLWERRAVQELAHREFDVWLPARTVGEYLARWGFTCQRPATRYYEQQPEAVKRWLEVDYPKIAQRAKDQGAEIHWADEAGVTTSSAAGARGFAPKGQTPVLKRVARPSRINHISSVTNQGKARFMVYKGTFKADTFIQFLDRLVKGAKGQKIIVIVDNLRVHHAKKVKAWVQERAERIELEYLPPYCPELNPDEYLNHDVKTNVHRKAMPKDPQQLEKNVRSHLHRISRSPGRIKAYFKAKYVRYAA